MLPRRSFLVAAAAMLGACGFRPLLKETEDVNVREQLAAIEVAGLAGRLGQLVRIAILDQLNPTALSVPSRYVLAVDLDRNIYALGIQLDNTITRYNLTLTAQFQLRRREDNQVLYRSSVRRIASYNVRRAPYATLVAEFDAERRAADEIGRNIGTLLAAHFAREDRPT